MKISREEVQRVAELAHLELSEAESETYRGQLDSILEYIDKLNEVDLSGVEPMAQVLFSSGDAAQSALRDDVERPCNTGSELLNQAPEARKPYFRVPKVIDR
ncbi:MAG TPA: Asp-tRNA(Asn)/Glu-tRNA(Gln) amidotransferase subunit GatC [Candidatus Acidoferrales bacterium]